jgi:hypothetical protein
MEAGKRRRQGKATLDTVLAPVDRGFAAVASDIADIRSMMATKADVTSLDTRIEDLETEMIDKFEHVDKQFLATHDRLREMSAEIAVIHRRVERLEELGASNAGFGDGGVIAFCYAGSRTVRAALSSFVLANWSMNATPRVLTERQSTRHL